MHSTLCSARVVMSVKRGSAAQLRPADAAAQLGPVPVGLQEAQRRGTGRRHTGSSRQWVGRQRCAVPARGAGPAGSCPAAPTSHRTRASTSRCTSSDTSTTDPSPVRSLRNSAAAIPNASCTAPLRSPSAPRCPIGSSQSDAGQRVAEPAARPERGRVVRRRVGVGAAHAVAVTAGVDQPTGSPRAGRRPRGCSCSRLDGSELVRNTSAGSTRPRRIAAPFLRLEVEAHAALPAVGHLHRDVDVSRGRADPLRHEAAVPVAVHRVLDLDDVGTPVGQQRAGDRHEHELRDLDDPHAAEHVRRWGRAPLACGSLAPLDHEATGGTAGREAEELLGVARAGSCTACATGRSASSFFATPMQSGHVVSLCG